MQTARLCLFFKDFSFDFRKYSLDTSMYRGYVSGTSYSYGRQFDMDEYYAADCTVRRIPRMPPRNHISPVVKCLLFSFNFLFWVSTAEPLWHFGLPISRRHVCTPRTPPATDSMDTVKVSNLESMVSVYCTTLHEHVTIMRLTLTSLHKMKLTKLPLIHCFDCVCMPQTAYIHDKDIFQCTVGVLEYSGHNRMLHLL